MGKFLLSPVIAILNRLRFTQKFALFFIFVLIPVVYSASLMISGHTQGIRAADQERFGVEYISVLRPLFEHMAQTRGMTNAFLNGHSEFKANIEKKQALVLKELAVLMDINTRLGDALKTGDKATQIQQDWQALTAKAFNQEAVVTFAEHTSVIEQVLALMQHVLETSSLMLDSEIDSHFMANSVGTRIPLLTETIGKARGLGAGIAAKGKFTTESYLKLTGFLQTIRNEEKAMNHTYDMVFENNTEIQEKLEDLRKTAANATSQFIQTSYKKLLEPDNIGIDTADYFRLGTDAITASLRLYDETLPLLDGLLVARVDNLKVNILVNLVSSIALVGGSIYLFIGFYLSMMTSINRIKDTVHAMSKGDLTEELILDSQDEMQIIANDMNIMIRKINDLISQITCEANQAVITANENAATSAATREGVNNQNIELEQVATAMNEMSATVQEVARNASSAAETTRNADNEANNGRNIVNQTIDSIRGLSKEIQQASDVIQQLEAETVDIGTVLDVIRNIADQTNLLALNAAIEAARAGEQGRGFAVVADEVRTLATRTSSSTQEIKEMIERLQQGARDAVQAMEQGNKQSHKTVELAAEAGSALKAITTAVDHITQMNEQIASAAEQQGAVAEEINRNIINVRDIAAQTVEGAKQTAASSESMNSVAEKLHSLVGEFKVS